MPLLDHFVPPLSQTHPWRSFHGAWAAAMARQLNQGVLPEGYYALPLINREGPVEIDVATLQQSSPPATAAQATALQTWTPPAPGLAMTVELPTEAPVEIQVFYDNGDPRLTAAIELVSPRNKDRPRARQAFAVKCVGYLQQGCSVIVVDTVTTRRADLHEEILALLEAATTEVAASSLAAVSYRVLGSAEATQLQLWPAALGIGQTLPTLPLWIADELAIPLDLEASYQMACRDLRIRQVG